MIRLSIELSRHRSALIKRWRLRQAAAHSRSPAAARRGGMDCWRIHEHKHGHHPGSFRDPAFLASLRQHHVGVVFTESEDYPPMPDLTSDIVCTRIMRTRSALVTGIDDTVLDGLARCTRAWQSGHQPTGLALIDPSHVPPMQPRDVYVFFISGAKERAPAAAQALLSRLR